MIDDNVAAADDVKAIELYGGGTDDGSADDANDDNGHVVSPTLHPHMHARPQDVPASNVSSRFTPDVIAAAAAG